MIKASLRFWVLYFMNATFFLWLPLGLKAQNLVQNGTFTQQPAVPWVFAPPGIYTEAYLAETTYGGTVGTNMVAEVDREASLRQTNIAVTPGQPYYISYRYSRRTGNGAAPNPVNFNVKVYDGASTFLNRNDIANNAAWQWTCVVDSFTPTTNVVAIDIVSSVTSTLGVIIDDITITPRDQPVTLTGQACSGGTLILNAPVSDPNAQYSNYQWSGPNGFTAVGPSITLTNVQPGQNGTYTCTMNLNTVCLQVTGTYQLNVVPTDFTFDKTICEGEVYHFYGRMLYATGTYDTLIPGNGQACDSNIKLNLNVTPLPDMTTTPGGRVSLCAGDSMLFKMNYPGAGASYQWFRDGAVLSGETGSTYLARDAGTYSVTGTENGCSDTSRKIVLTVNPLPEAKIALRDAEVKCSFDTLTLEALGEEALAYIWSPSAPFLAITGAESRVVKGIFPKSVNPVSLLVINEYGCRSADSIVVHTRPCCEIFVPNAFSPNHDGLNDQWRPYLQPGQKFLAMKIYDRWGDLVYDMPPSLKGWDGNFKAKEASAAVYMYYLQYTCGDREVYEKRGDLILVR